MKASEEAIATASKIPLEPSAYKSIVRELYEGLRQYAEALGIKLGEEGAILGIGKGRVPRWAGHLPFKIKQSNFELNVPAWYVDSENVGILLGQEVFFDTFRIKFEKDQDTFEIVPAKKS